MSTQPFTLPKKRKVKATYDGSEGVSHGRQSGITGVHIAKPFIHPLDMFASHESAERYAKRPRFDTIKRAQFPAYEEESMRKAAARKAGEHDLIRVST